MSKNLRKGIVSGIAFGLTFAMGIAFCGVVKANSVPWSNASGTEADFSYSNGSEDNGLAGSPNTVNDGFQFTVNHFKAESTGGAVVDTVFENIYVTLTPNPGLRISSINATLTGDYSVLSALQPASAGYYAHLTASQHGQSYSKNSVLMPPEFTSGAAPISDGLTLNIPSTMTGPIDLIFQANVGAGSNLASAATAELKYLQLGVVTAQAPSAIPLPAAIATFPLGALVAGWARKRFAR